MAITLSDAEVQDFLQASFTGVLTTLRRDGWPVSLPLWYALDQGRVVMTTPRSSRKIARIASDPRACFLVEAGGAWTELRAVMLYGVCEITFDPAEVERFNMLIDARYPEPQRPPLHRLPPVTTKLYASKVGIRFVPRGHRISWDNRKIRLRDA